MGDIFCELPKHCIYIRTSILRGTHNADIDNEGSKATLNSLTLASPKGHKYLHNFS